MTNILKLTVRDIAAMPDLARAHTMAAINEKLGNNSLAAKFRAEAQNITGNPVLSRSPLLLQGDITRARRAGLGA